MAVGRHEHAGHRERALSNMDIQIYRIYLFQLRTFMRLDYQRKFRFVIQFSRIKAVYSILQLCDFRSNLSKRMKFRQLKYES